MAGREVSVKRKRSVDLPAASEISAEERVWPRHGPGDGATPPRTDDYYRGLYTGDLDFRELAKQDADFAAVLKPNGQLDFSDPQSVKQLTVTLLRLHFDVRVSLPDDRLCPAVPNRHNYVLWVQGLVESTAPVSSHLGPGGGGGRVFGLDIGTGASAIYPLLLCAQRADWFVLATDADAASAAHAARNAALNPRLARRIRILPVRDARTSTLVPDLDELGVERLDFAMVNPPFYGSREELERAAAGKARPPNSACTGAPVEMVTPGGEVAFVRRLVAESAMLRGRVRWYSAMLGKAGSLGEVVEAVRRAGVDNYAVTEFVQGSRTRRWGVAWSFAARRPANDVARGVRALAAWKGLLPPAVESTVLTVDLGAQGRWGSSAAGAAPLAELVAKLADGLAALVGGLDGLESWRWDRQRLAGVGRARENVWGRAWRRKGLHGPASQGGGEGGEGGGRGGGEGRKSRGEDEMDSDEDDEEEEEMAFGFLVSIDVRRTELELKCRWLEGHSDILFESFCGFLRSRMIGIVPR